MAKSTIKIVKDSAGEYEIEVFDKQKPKGLIICVHGRGVHRWDGENFFYKIAEYFDNYTTYLVEQNQFDKDVCVLNPLNTATERVQKLIELASKEHPGAPIILMGHSLGCGIITKLKLDNVSKVIFVAPTAGDDQNKLINRYGDDIKNGKLTQSVDGLKKYISKEYFNSVKGIIWEKLYNELATRFQPIYVFESGSEEIVGEERFEHRKMPFSSYQIIPGATHNYHDNALDKLIEELNKIL